MFAFGALALVLYFTGHISPAALAVTAGVGVLIWVVLTKP
jgi:hypothetical protein